MVKEKLTTGFAGLKHLFKANDPTGQGNDVSRYESCLFLKTL